MKGTRRWIAAILAVCMMLSLLPVTALGVETEAPVEEVVEEIVEEPAEAPDEEPSEETGEEPSEETGEEPSEETGEEPSEETDEEVADEGSLTAAAEAMGAVMSSADIAAWLGLDDSPDAVTIDSAEKFVLLSYLDWSHWAGLEITLSVTGNLDLSEKVTVEGAEYAFQGIGRADAPFTGTLTWSNAQATVMADRALFGGLSSAAAVSGYNGAAFAVTWVGDGSQPMLAERYVLAEGDTTLPVRFSVGTKEGVTVSAGPLAGVIAGTGVLVVEDQVTYGGGAVTIRQDENAGLLCNTLEGGSIRLAEGFVFPAGGASITAGSGSAGGLVGKMYAGTRVEVAFSSEQPYSVSVTGAENAGGLAGLAEAGATVAGAEGDGKIVLTANVTGSGVSANAGGLFGSYTAAETQGLPLCVQFVAGVTVTHDYNEEEGTLGGLFGVLTLDGTDAVTFTIDGTQGWCGNGTFAVKTVNKCEARGGLIGRYDSAALRNGLVITGLAVQSEMAYAGNNGKTPKYHGGLIGVATGNAYVQVQNVTATAEHPYATSPFAGFGGVVGRLESGCAADVEGFSLTTTAPTSKDPEIWEGGGVIGEAGSGSVLRLSGTTDMSGVNYQGWYQAGQLVGYQDCALVYAAEGWSYTRGRIYSSKKSEDLNYGANDIANYGQVYRLGGSGLSAGLVTLNEQHQVVFDAAKKPSLDGGAISLGDKDAFALLAIAWQSRGVFAAVNNVTTENWNALYAASITLTGDVDLTGTGVIGLTRDNTGESPYTGTLDGGGHTVTVDIGGAYGTYASGAATFPYGNGALVSYDDVTRHNAAGLFARIGSGGTVKNVTVAGTANYFAAQNSKPSNQGGGRFGTLAGLVSGTVTLESVTAQAVVKVGSINSISVGEFYAGGLLGEGQGAQLTLNKVTAGCSIELSVGHNGYTTCAHAGGVIGSMSDSGTKLICEDVTLSGSLTATGGNQAQIGGLAATIRDGGTVEIRKVCADGLTVTADKASSTGGLLGYCWRNTDVTFTEGSAGSYAFRAVKSSVSATSGSLGGLVYYASGKWTVNDYGIDMAGAKLTAKYNMGVLVCCGYKRKDDGFKLNNVQADMTGLYLELTAHWDTAYALEGIQVSANGTFDEFVAYTASSSNTVNDNGVNGVISLATENRAGVDVNGRNTYGNRTDIKKSNGSSRYYYNLDKVKAEVGTPANGWLDTPEKLLLWSVWKYAAGGIRENFKANSISQEKPSIGTSSTSSPVQLDMKGLSYYPVDLDQGAAVQNAVITFYNETIETAENGNKSTQGGTQHYGMHFGLFRNLTAANNDRTLSVQDVTLAGTVGRRSGDGGASGALLCGTVSGSVKDGKVCTAAVTVKNLTLDGLRVHGAAENNYAPLLIHGAGSCARLTFGDINSKTDFGVVYNGTGLAASSLLGRMGGDTESYVNLSFAGMKLPDEQGVFTRATLLDSYRYAADGTSAGTYLFFKADERVTYGRELRWTGDYVYGSLEYPDMQNWYYDEDGYGDDTNLIKDGAVEDFSGYLPYVYTAYDAEGTSHELCVNQRAADLLEGCGTYGHPYAIRTERELKDLALYIATGSPKHDWKVRITANQESFHTTDAAEDITLIARGGTWWKWNGTKVDESFSVSNEVMRQYLRSAYFNVQGAIELENFAGLGTEADPFRGVLVGSSGAVVTLRGRRTGGGLIAYSYGSVVKGLTLQYSDEGKTLTYEGYPEGVTGYYPKAFFGGVIGCVMGGDNVIDGVTVTMDNGWLTLSGEQAHLLQVGGYVGSVCGGGVIFRSTAGGAVKPAAGGGYYVNPYVGRVLNGYAFSEGCTLANGDDQPIVDIGGFDSDLVTVDGETVSVSSKEGLLVLSALIRSGGAGGGGTVAYYGGTATFENAVGGETFAFGGDKYGKVRSADYSGVGSDSGAEDFRKALADDRTAPGRDNAPYLAQKYGGGACFELLAAGKTLHLELKTEGTSSTVPQLDMTEYGNAYGGLSAGYVSNALRTVNGTDAGRVIPQVGTVNGNGGTLTVKRTVREYADDDFHADSVGGLFDLLRVNGEVVVKDLSVTGDVTLTYEGEGASTAPAYAGVGGLAGKVFGSTGSVRAENVGIRSCEVVSPNSAGGLMGCVGVGGNSLLTGSVSGSITLALAGCLYTGLTATGGKTAGGYVGLLQCASAAVTAGSGTPFIAGKDSAIQAKEAAGGLFGTAQTALTVGTADRTMQLSNVSAAATTTESAMTRNYGAGGVVGVMTGTLVAENCTLHGVCINKVEGKPNYAPRGGGIVADITNNGYKGGDGTIRNCRVLGASEIYGFDAGGIVGKHERAVTVTGCTVSGYTDNDGNSRLTVKGESCAAGLVGWGAAAAALYDGTVAKADIGSANANLGGSGYAAGVVIGNSAVNASNIRLNDVQVTGHNTGDTALLAKSTGSSLVAFAGVSLQGGSAVKANGADFKTTVSAANYYAAFADYTGKGSGGTETLIGAGDSTPRNAPYVTTSPVSALTVEDGGTTYYLHGDGAAWTEATSADGKATLKTNARLIYEERMGAKDGRFAYAVAKENATLSTYNTVNSDKTPLAKDFPVLVCSGDVDGILADYLDTVTNGGFSQAKKQNAVTAKAEVYALQNGVFRKDAGAEQALTVSGSGSSLVFGKTLAFDNGRDRFTLLTVTFRAGERTYSVYAPLIVQRKLEVDFSATLTYGTNFLPKNYEELTNHVLESSGNPITGYLTFTYNSKNGAFADYGWQEYINGGRDVTAPFDKVIALGASLPQGTQFTLIDLQDAARTAYTFTAEGTISELSLSQLKDAGGETFRSASIGEVLGATAAESAGGRFVQTDRGATVLVDGQGYRLADEEKDADKARYDIRVDGMYKEENGKTVSTAQERYFMVITVPKSDSSYNGAVKARFRSESIEYSVNALKIDGKPDNSSNTASTYLISSGYQQALEETLTGSVDYRNVTKEANTLSIALKDTITVPTGQAYNSHDQLYLRFTASLQTGKTGESAAAVIPDGTAGKVTFYVYTGSGTSRKYYRYEDGEWVAGDSEKQAAVAYDCTASGGSLDMILSTDGTQDNAISLEPLRAAALGQTGDAKQFFVEAEAEVALPVNALDVIPLSKLENGTPEEYAKLSYLSRISVDKRSLSYSGMLATLSTTRMKYYREKDESALLHFNAENAAQLGINLLDPVEEFLAVDAEGVTYAEIDTVARYDLRAIRDLRALFSESRCIRFTLSLERKTGDAAYTTQENASRYLTVMGAEYDAETNRWWWEVSQEQYYTEGGTVDGTLTRSVQLRVHLDGIEDEERFYANYRVVLTAELIDRAGTVRCAAQDALIYTMARLKPAFVQGSDAQTQH